MARAGWLGVILCVSMWCGPSQASPPGKDRDTRKNEQGAGEGNVSRPGILRGELATMARDLKTFLSDRGEDSIAVGAFTGPAQMPGNAGAGIIAVLTEELGRQGIRVARRASLGLKGEYKPAFEVLREDEPELINPPGPAGQQRKGRNAPRVAPPKALSAVLKAKVEDSDGRILLELKEQVFDDDNLAALFGLSFQRSFPNPNAQPRDRDWKRDFRAQIAVVRNSYESPRPAVVGTIIRPRPDSPYAIEILVKREDGRYAPRTPRDEDGLAFVPLSRGEVYAVRLTNRSAYDAAVTLTIDGLSIFAFSDRKGDPRVIVPPRKSVTIVGWHRTDQVSDEFLITSYAKGAAAELNTSAADVGMITATFAAAWTDKRPPDEPSTAGGLADGADLGDATGKGKQVESKFKRVDREIGTMRAAVSVRYTRKK